MLPIPETIQWSDEQVIALLLEYEEWVKSGRIQPTNLSTEKLYSLAVSILKVFVKGLSLKLDRPERTIWYELLSFQDVNLYMDDPYERSPTKGYLAIQTFLEAHQVPLGSFSGEAYITDALQTIADNTGFTKVDPVFRPKLLQISDINDID